MNAPIVAFNGKTFAITVQRYGTDDELNDIMSAADELVAEHAPAGAEPLDCIAAGDLLTFVFPVAAYSVAS